jgi:hypothetical protein
MNIATADKLVLQVRDGILRLTGKHVILADGWYWCTMTDDDSPMWGPFDTSDDADEAARDASVDGVKVRTYIDKGDPEFEIIEACGSLPAGQDWAFITGEVSRD